MICQGATAVAETPLLAPPPIARVEAPRWAASGGTDDRHQRAPTTARLRVARPECQS